TSVTGQSAHVIATAHSSASVADTGFFSSGQWNTNNYWNFGMTSTASPYVNGFNISYGTGNPAPEANFVAINLATTGVVTIPNGDLYVSRTLAVGGPQIVLNNLSTTLGAVSRMVIATSADGLHSDAYTLL